MYINWFNWIIFFHDPICYTKILGVRIILQLSQRNGKLPSPRWKQGNYLVIPIYAQERAIKFISLTIFYKVDTRCIFRSMLQINWPSTSFDNYSLSELVFNHRDTIILFGWYRAGAVSVKPIFRYLQRAIWRMWNLLILIFLRRVTWSVKINIIYLLLLEEGRGGHKNSTRELGDWGGKYQSCKRSGPRLAHCGWCRINFHTSTIYLEFYLQHCTWQKLFVSLQHYDLFSKLTQCALLKGLTC